jgi:hypothetical protein
MLAANCAMPSLNGQNGQNNPLKMKSARPRVKRSATDFRQVSSF